LYEYGHEQLKQGKRDEIIKQIENKFVNRKFEKKGVVSPCHQRLYGCINACVTHFQWVTDRQQEK
jgi:hypothetical protein